MIRAESVDKRNLHRIELSTDLTIVGGGLSGVCAAITAARAGLKVVLVQDRPVLGGNASSEVRLWILGATSHMGNNNRWAREGGVVDEVLVENMYRNPEGNALIFDSILLDKIKQEPNIELLLNTAVYAVEKEGADKIAAVIGFCSQNSTEYFIQSPLFCDASGDGIVGFLSGAIFRMGAESKEEFGELFAPEASYGELLGHSLYFYSKDTQKPVKFVAPSFALTDIQQIPRYRNFNTKEHGCKLWWIEYGGRLDTVHDTEKIKWELWKVVYGVWDYIKNSGNFPEAETMTLEWVGTIPGKRESRRFEGDYIMKQQDIVAQQPFEDAVAFGGWSIDLHPADGVFSEKPGCNQWHSKGVYQIPYRSLYSKNISNLFLAGRIISVSHVAFASTRVMATAAYAAQAVGMAAAICHQKNLLPNQLVANHYMQKLQQSLIQIGHYIPGVVFNNGNDLTQKATIHASSELALASLRISDIKKPIISSVAQMLPFKKGNIPAIVIDAAAEADTTLDIELRISSKPNNHTPDITLEKKTVSLHEGRNVIPLHFNAKLEHDTYVFVTILKNELVSLYYSEQRVTGILSVFNHINKAVSNFGKQEPPDNIGMEAFEFWCPQRRPEGQNIALQLKESITDFAASNIRNGIDRPTSAPNAWVADWKDSNPSITLAWEQPQQIAVVDLFFDTDYDHPMESVLMSHPEHVMPFCVRNYTLKDDKGNIIHQVTGNYQTINHIVLPKPIVTQQLVLEVAHPSATVPAAVFAIRCYS
jgi:hypothetical protein